MKKKIQMMITMMIFCLAKNHHLSFFKEMMDAVIVIVKIKKLSRKNLKSN